MNWRQKLISADNSEVDIKAVISALALFIAVVIYTAYAIKGLIVKWDMPASIRDITAALIIGGVLGAGSTLFNQRLGVPPTPVCKEEETETPPAEGPVG
ncbi:MAG: hypothetical protein PHU44_13645 [Syntrophales bacterium]|nr:hypothetical protein [Syntrophales bacterium]MDD5640159.1 hypothetical protein [Syntrophales bacterium]